MGCRPTWRSRNESLWCQEDIIAGLFIPREVLEYEDRMIPKHMIADRNIIPLDKTWWWMPSLLKLLRSDDDVNKSDHQISVCFFSKRVKEETEEQFYRSQFPRTEMPKSRVVKCLPVVSDFGVKDLLLKLVINEHYFVNYPNQGSD